MSSATVEHTAAPTTTDPHPLMSDLREVAQRAGLSVEEVSRHLGITRQHLTRLQRAGDVIPPRLVEAACELMEMAEVIAAQREAEAEASAAALATWRADVEGWVAHMREHSARSDATVKTYELHVSWLARDLAADVPSPWHVESHQLEAWLDRHQWSAATRSRVLVSLNAFYRWALLSDLCRRSPVAGVAVAPPKKPGPARLACPPAWMEPLRNYSRYLYAGSRSKRTRRQYEYQLLNLAGLFADPWDVTHLDLVAYVGRSDLAPNTRKSMRTALRSFYRWAEDTGALPTEVPNPAEKLPTVRVRRALPRPAPDEAVLQALEVADNRVHLMLSIALYTGVRRFELAQIHSDDIGDDVLLVHGKGDKDRLVPLHPDLATMLRAELRRRREGVELLEGWGQMVPPAEGWLFPGPHGDHLTPDHVAKLVRATLPDKWTTHTLRHRFATQAYRVQRDLRAVQELLGHERPETTAVYAQVPGESLRSAVAGVGPVTLPERS